jgi:hypothetical protein
MHRTVSRVSGYTMQLTTVPVPRHLVPVLTEYKTRRHSACYCPEMNVLCNSQCGYGTIIVPVRNPRSEPCNPAWLRAAYRIIGPTVVWYSFGSCWICRVSFDILLSIFFNLEKYQHAQPFFAMQSRSHRISSAQQHAIFGTTPFFPTGRLVLILRPGSPRTVPTHLLGVYHSSATYR